MDPRELLLLSPYRYPAQYSLMLGNEDMACWLNGYAALWHPAVLWQAKGPPRFDPPYDYEEPRGHHVYALPEAPPLILPDDWDQRVKNVGAVAFRATQDREATFNNLKAALQAHGETSAQAPGGPPVGFDTLLNLEPDKIAPFLGVGLGYLLLSSLSEAMEHENLLETDAFWQDIQQAIAAAAGLPYTAPEPAPAAISEPSSSTDYGDFSPSQPAEQVHDSASSENLRDPGFEEFAPSSEPQAESDTSLTDNSEAVAAEPPAGPDAWYAHLQSAAQRLLSAREVLYPVTIHLLDLLLLDDKRLQSPWPDSYEFGLPLNVIAAGMLLEKMAKEQPQRLAELRERVQAEKAEVCGGSYVEREDPLLPVDSQLWNLLKGQAVARDLLGVDLRVFARKRFGYQPQMPLLLSTTGFTRALLLTFDEAGVPQYQGCLVSWPSPDGKQIDAFVRQPHPADGAQTFFNLGHYLFKTTREDQTATVALLHTATPAGPWYRDWMELSRLAPVMGTWQTLSQYFNEVMSGEHVSALSPDEFHSDFLSERVTAQSSEPVSAFARHCRLRRRLDACWTLAAVLRGLAGRSDSLNVEEDIAALEDQLEKSAPSPGASLRAPGVASPEGTPEAPGVASGLEEISGPISDLEKKVGAALAGRLQARAADNQPGYLVLNPCNFTRRVALELEPGARPLPIAGPVKACQLDPDLLRVVVEVPALGFAWLPREGPPGTPPPPPRMRLADKNAVRNEFFEAEVDPATGGLKAIRDRKTFVNRLGQRLVFNPGSTMRATEVKVTSAGPAVGEIVSEGVLVGEHEQVLARFRQRFRAWLGRPMLELRIELFPEQPPAGYAWHAYFGARFAWRDERTVLLRGVNGTGYVTTHTRPQTPDYLELRLARQGTVLFPGGLPFHQRQQGRMLDIILMPEGEKSTAFELGVGLDRDQPMLTAQGLISPVVVVPTTKGSPHIGDTGWLFHLDAPNLLLSQMRPGGLEARSGEEGGERIDALTARLLECGGFSGQAEFRCVRDPKRATLLDARGNFLVESTTSGDAVFLEVSPNDLVHLQIEFS
jgi:hypothetical protein